MPTLGMLPARHPELGLKFVTHDPAVTRSTEVTGLFTVTWEQVLEDGVPPRLPDGQLVLITGTAPSRHRGQIATALESLIEHMSRDGSTGLIIRIAPAAHQSYPQAALNRADALGMPLLVSAAPADRWEGFHEKIQGLRLAFAERQAAQLSSLVQELPAQLADPRAMQRIADWVARVLDVQVLVTEPERVLAASPATAAEDLAQAIIRQAVDGNKVLSGPHTQLISLAPASAADTVLAVARRTPFDDADLRLLRYAAKLLGLVDQAHREYRAASDASRAARSAALSLLLDGEVAKARRVMANLAPGLLDANTARVYVVETSQAGRESAARRCIAAVGHQALVVPDPKEERRILITHPIAPEGETSTTVANELTRVVGALGDNSSLGGSGIYSLSLLAEALQEASSAQRFAACQPDSVSLSLHGCGLVHLLPQPEAQCWAQRLLQPLMRDGAQWEWMRDTLPTALAYPYTVAARRLNLHRNTVMRRASRAAELLRMDFGRVRDRVVVSMALELVTQREAVDAGQTCAPELRSLELLLAAPQIQSWAHTLVRPIQADRRDLLATTYCWLAFDSHVEPAARALGLSEVTVRSHLRAVETHLQRSLASLAGVRDLYLALHVATGHPDLHSGCASENLCGVA